MELEPRSQVGISIIVFHPSKEAILMGIRKGSHGSGTWGLPGGHLEFSESFESCSVRELREETNLKVDVKDVVYVCTTNNVLYFENKHYVDITTTVMAPSENVTLMEPDKCEKWEWVSFKDIKNKTPKFAIMEHILNRINLDELHDAMISAI